MKKYLIISLVIQLFAVSFLNWQPAIAETALEISNIQTTVAGDSATITWSTNLTSNGRIDYGLDVDDYKYYLVEGSAAGTQHAVTLYGLLGNETYHYKITAKSFSQEVTSFDRIFVTKKSTDNQAPIISKVSAVYITGTTATIQWETDEPADSRVHYGNTENYTKVASASKMVTAHDVTITGLQSGAFYHFLVKSRDKDGNISVYYDMTFTTYINNWIEKAALDIYDVNPVSPNDLQIGETTVGVSWRTNKLATGKVSFGKTDRLGSGAEAPAPRDFFHAVTLKNLTAGTKYYFKVESRDVFGVVAASNIYTFETKKTATAGGATSAPAATPGTSTPTPAIPVSQGPSNPVAGIVAGQVLGASYQAGQTELEPIFYASFNDDFDADIAGGSKQPKIYGIANLTDGLFGKAAAFNYISGLEYQRANNFNVRKGTIVFWFKPNWDINDGLVHHFFNLNKRYENVGNKYFQISKVIKSKPTGSEATIPNNRLSFHLEDGMDLDFTAYLEKETAANEWYFLSVTWKYEGSQLPKIYLNGSPSDIKYILPNNVWLTTAPNFGEKFYVRDVENNSSLVNELNTTIDELMIFDRDLSDIEIDNLYKKGLAALGQNTGTGTGNTGNNGNDNNNQNTGGQILGASTLDYTQASALLRIKGTPDVYAIMNGRRHHVANPTSFDIYGYRWQDVRDVSREELYGYPLADLVRTPADTAVYHIYERPQNQWLKLAIPSPTVFVSYENNYWGNIIVINEIDMAAYPKATLLRRPNDTNIYQLENDITRKIPSEEIFNRLGYRLSEVVDINQVHFETYNPGPDIE